MNLATRTEEIHTLLVAQSSSYWEIELTFRMALDPLAEIERGTEGVFIVPIVNEYNLDQSNKRTKVVNLSASPRIAVVIARPFAARDVTGIDVSTWAEVKKILNFREQVDKLIITSINDISTVDPEPPLETTYDKRWYMSITEFTFNEVQC
jgi:hypothetical protein